MQLKKNLEEGDVFKYPASKRTAMTFIRKPSRSQVFEAEINNIFTDKPIRMIKCRTKGKGKPR